MLAHIPTTFLILSDTHGEDMASLWPSNSGSLPHVDVAIHCGDLTEESKLSEFHAALDLLRSINADLKLVIAGNHDLSMDVPLFRDMIGEAMRLSDRDRDSLELRRSSQSKLTSHQFSWTATVNPENEIYCEDRMDRDDDGDAGGMGSAAIDPKIDADLVHREFGYEGEPLDLFSRARNENIHLLREGIHDFELANGAFLRVFASPATPSLSSCFPSMFENGARGAFQFDRQTGHEYPMRRGDNIDVVITHGPPLGILDRTDDKVRAGCPDLFAAVERTRPRMHCFGHVHEAWGAKVVTWRKKTHSVNAVRGSGSDDDGNGNRASNSSKVSHFTDIDHDRSVVIESLSTLKSGRWDSEQVVEEKKATLRRYINDGYCSASFSARADGDGEDHHMIDGDEDGHSAADRMDVDVDVDGWVNGGGQGPRAGLEEGMQTLFVNAAIQGLREEDGQQLPWIVEIDLREAPPCFDVDMDFEDWEA